MAPELDLIAPAQSILYRFLAEGFSAPTEARLTYLTEMIETVGAACEEMVESGEATTMPDVANLEQVAAWARLGSLGELQAEYTRLFVKGMPTTPARLLESVHREGMLVGESTERATEAYMAFGLQVAEREPDHLTTELEFMAYLTGTPVAPGEEAERYQAARQQFAAEHLGAWAEDLAGKIRSATESPLYRALGDLLQWLVEAEVPQVAA